MVTAQCCHAFWYRQLEFESWHFKQCLFFYLYEKWSFINFVLFQVQDPLPAQHTRVIHPFQASLSPGVFMFATNSQGLMFIVQPVGHLTAILRLGYVILASVSLSDHRWLGLPVLIFFSMPKCIFLFFLLKYIDLTTFHWWRQYAKTSDSFRIIN